MVMTWLVSIVTIVSSRSLDMLGPNAESDTYILGQIWCWAHFILWFGRSGGARFLTLLGQKFSIYQDALHAKSCFVSGMKFIVARGMALLVNLRGLHLNFLFGALQRFHMASFSPISALFFFSWIVKSVINCLTLYGEFSRCSRPLELKTFVHMSVLSLFRVSLPPARAHLS